MHPGNLLLHATAQVHFGGAAAVVRGSGRGDISASYVKGFSTLAGHQGESPFAAAAAAKASATAVQKAPLDQQPWLYYRWGGHLFRLPTPTCTCKVIDFGLSSMRVSGARRWLCWLSHTCTCTCTCACHVDMHMHMHMHMCAYMHMCMHMHMHMCMCMSCCAHDMHMCMHMTCTCACAFHVACMCMCMRVCMCMCMCSRVLMLIEGANLTTQLALLSMHSYFLGAPLAHRTV